MKDRRLLAYSAAFKAGSYLGRSLKRGIKAAAQEKFDLDLVSEADKKAEKIIVSEIKARINIKIIKFTILVVRCRLSTSGKFLTPEGGLALRED